MPGKYSFVLHMTERWLGAVSLGRTRKTGFAFVRSSLQRGFPERNFDVYSRAGGANRGFFPLLLRAQ